MDEETTKRLKASILVCIGKTPHEVLEYLRFEPDLSIAEKNFIYTWCTPHIYADGDLAKRIYEYRVMAKNQTGWLSSDLGEMAIQLGAIKSPQYKRFMKHLLMAFDEPKNIFPVQGNSEDTCCICKKPVYDFTNWNTRCQLNPALGEQDRREYLNFSSKGTSLSLCLDCMVQLQSLSCLLKSIQPEYWKFENWKKLGW